ncbi:MAG: thioredoxin [Firmicutes bacterium]|nr:thioredoxin [Bacillota bacterium]
MSEIKLTEDNFEKEVLNSDIPVLVDFWASWCGPCMMLAPVVEEIAKEYEGKIKVGKLNVDEQQKLAITYKISSIPALKLFKNGEVADSTVGYMPKEELEAFINNAL